MIKNRWMLHSLAAPLSKRPIAEITAAEILVIPKKVELSGRRETARKLRGTIGTIFRYAVATLRAPNDPTYALKGALSAPMVVHQPTITDEQLLGALMTTIEEYDGWPTLRAAIHFLALTMTRLGEVRFMRRNEIVWPKSTWTIPAQRMKMRKPHDVPLSRQAITVLPLKSNQDRIGSAQELMSADPRITGDLDFQFFLPCRACFSARSTVNLPSGPYSLVWWDSAQ